jgi:chitodextrinase
MQFLLDGVALGAEDGAAPYTLSWDTTLSANGSHTLSAIARDTSGNTQTSAPVGVVVSNDFTLPSSPSNLVATTVSSSTIGISWVAASDNVGVTGYGIFRDSQQVGTSTTLSILDTGLSPGTTYVYTVAAFDAAGNTSAPSTGLSVTTAAPPPPDSIAPSVPSGLSTSNITATQVTFSWLPATDNVGVTGYRIFRNSSAVGTTSATNFADGGLTANTGYSYTVSAYDAAGNSSLESAALPVTTKPSSAASYTTNFPLTENPISEGGAWAQGGKKTGLDWSNVRTNGSIAYGTQTGSGGYDDSIALLSGFSPNYRVTAVVHFAGSRSSSTSSHEVELILRGNYTAHTQHLYECNLGYDGSGWYSQIMRMNGIIGAYAEIDSVVNSPPGVKNGDVFVCEITGSTINSYLNGMKLATANDSTYATGQPGIGFFWRGTENITDFAFSSVTVTQL